MPDFSLHAVTATVVREHESADPDVLRDTVLAAIPRKEYGHCLSLLLREYVTAQIRQTRPSSDPAMGNPTPSDLAPGRSWKRDPYAWQRYRLHVGSREFKFLPDCTFDDLMAAANIRRDHAQATLIEADRWEACADLIKEHGAATLSEVPITAVAAILGGTSS